MPTAPYVNPKVQFLDASGKPLAGGLLYTYAAGTTTPKTTYTDSAGAVPNANPIVLDSGGMATIYYDSGSYKLLLETSGAVTVWTQDNISSPSFSSPLVNVTIDTASGNIIKVNGNTLSASAGSATITVPNVTDTLVNLASVQSLSNKTLTSPIINNATVTSPTVTNASTTGTDSGAETLQNKTLSGAATGNSILVRSLVGQQANQTGNGAAQAITAFAYTIPANTVSSTSDIEIEWYISHLSGTASVAYTMDFGELTGIAIISTALTQLSGKIIIAKGPGNTLIATSTAWSTGGTPILNATATITTLVSASCGVTLKFNVANTDQITPQSFRVKQIQ